MPSRRLVSPILILTAVLLLGGFVGAIAAGAAKARPTSMAVVDVQKVFDSLAERTQIEAELQTQADKIKQEELDRQKDLKQLQSDLEILARGTPAFVTKSDELEQKMLEFQAWRNFRIARLNRERGIRLEEIYRKMADSIGRVAKENGFDLVMYKEGPIRFPADKPDQISTIIQVRKLLWSAEDLDLTEQVVQKMNNDYRNMPGSKSN